MNFYINSPPLPPSPTSGPTPSRTGSSGRAKLERETGKITQCSGVSGARTLTNQFTPEPHDTHLTAPAPRRARGVMVNG